ncbi:YadA-like family protein [Nodosilinea sp. LEGE 07088]|uniref:YadA-like family protein n=1 Tax=Nodosilinea sp. LEGE 07088 TaxID=2777968 RepID=UPI00187E2229|nr:YadA-like family protein [Nodosilinea sp. LEGE 07088]MBE9140296.1 YadA-like family protein [Nodosilinea sp. LEGE 07088]
MKSTLGLVSAGLVSAALLAFPLSASAQQTPDYNYVGIGGGDDGFVVNGKISITDNLSVRPAVATDFNFNDSEDVFYLLPVTYDFNALDADGTIYPFVGAGIGGDLGNTSTIDFALTGGVDYRFGDRWVANGSVSYLPFADDDEVGFTLGVGYVFGNGR